MELNTPCTYFKNFRDMEAYGFNMLTGEACAYSFRYLFDISERGREILNSFLGMPYNTEYAYPWNSRVGENASVGSVMLTRKAAFDLMIYVALHVDRAAVVYWSEDYGTVIGYDAIYPEAEDYYISAKYNRFVNYASPKSVEGRNQHQFSGRVF